MIMIISGIPREQVFTNLLNDFIYIVIFWLENMMLAGVYFSMFGHYWYSLLDRRFPPKSPSAVRKKV